MLLSKEKKMTYKVTNRYRNKCIYNFKCPDGNTFSERVYSEDDVYCPLCNKLSSKVIGAPHLSSRMGTDPTSAQAGKWAKMHREEAQRGDDKT